MGIYENIAFFKQDDGLLIHADNYSEANLLEFMNAHNRRPSSCIMTMMTFLTGNPKSCGIVRLNQDGIVTEFHEKVEDPPGRLANAAIYILSQELISLIGKNFTEAKDISTDIIPKLLGHIYTYQTDKLLVDVGTVKAYKKLNEYNII